MMKHEGENAEEDELTTPVVWSSYLVRLWREAERGEWRGQIVHLQTQQARLFINLAQIQEFLVRFAPGLDRQGDEE
jgi:hypothetical protein